MVKRIKQNGRYYTEIRYRGTTKTILWSSKPKKTRETAKQARKQINTTINIRRAQTRKDKTFVQTRLNRMKGNQFTSEKLKGNDGRTYYVNYKTMKDRNRQINRIMTDRKYRRQRGLTSVKIISVDTRRYKYFFQSPEYDGP